MLQLVRRIVSTMVDRCLLAILIAVRLISASGGHDENVEYLKKIGAGARDVDENIAEDSMLLVPELVQKYGYPIEVHEVDTEDGYILEVHRLPRPGSTPILMVHGLLDSSSTWVIMGPNKGFGYILYDQDYDVWMANVRGNRYSRKHKVLSTKDNEFWRFSFHEIGKFDIPSLIDYVLSKTGNEKLHYIGHSQGTAVFWIMCDEIPEYNDKIISMNAMAPVAYVKHCKSPVVRVMEFFLNTLTGIAKLISWNEFLPSSDLIGLVGNMFCKDETITQGICSNIMFLITGFNEDQLNTTMLPVILGHTPAGASARQVIHFGQLKRSGYFRQYDHGIVKNLFKYGTITPPKYDLSKVKVKVALHYSTNDWLAEPRDVEALHQALSNPIGKFLVGDKNFNHLDFVWGIDARKHLYERVIKIIKHVESGFF